ncbi:beta strand repeat-containing protein [Cytophaga aurantiaca]|uniref:beta strand repeat-containing protein n=1 Tax=Cytophaga aurantiaca TaxID=29530 RepID=UPI000377137E|nr:T9SS type A sorting domain-containing protein [Cytophaga aurantiaca]
MLSYNFSNFYILKNVKSVFSITVILGLILCFLLQAQNAEAKTTSTIGSGTWGDVTKWSNGLPADGDIININNVMDFTNVNVNIAANTTFNFNAGASGSSIPLSLGMSSSTSVLNIYSNVSFAGGINLNAGTIHVYGGATLTVTNQINQAGTLIIIDSGSNFNVTGNYTNNGGNINVDGLLAITGNYDGQNSAAVVIGNGDITTTGHMIGINNSSIFGVLNPTCSGVPDGCDGRNLSGSGCSKTATVTPNTTSACSGATISFTSTIDNVGGYNSVVYQWQSRSIGDNFSDISGATLSTYSAVPTISTFYRIVVKTKQNGGDPYCYTYSSGVLINISSCNNTWVGGATGNQTNWLTAANWSLNSVPTSTQDVVIPAGRSYYPIITGAVNAKAVVIDLGAVVTITGSGTLNAYGNILANGTLTANANSTIVMNQGAAQSVWGAGITYLYNLTINNSSGVSILSAMKIKGTLSLTKGQLTTYSYLTIDIDSGGNIGYASTDVGSIDGVVTVYRAVNNITSHYISCPLNGVTANDIVDDIQVINPASGNTRLFQFNNTSYKWVGVTDMNTTLSPSSAYSLWFGNATSLDFTGTYTHTASYSYTGPNVATQFMLVSNPYPSTLDWEAASGWTKSGVNNAIYFWNPTTNSYTSYIHGQGTNSATQYIPAMNSFFVAYNGTTPSTATVVMNGLVRTPTSASMWRAASDETVRLTLKSTTAADETLIRFNEDATNEFDSDLDAFKMTNPSTVPSIYTEFGSTKYSINSIADPSAKDTIAVYTKVPADGDYVLSITSSNPSIEYVLVDKKLGTETVVTTRDYSFTALKTDDLNRFDLQLRQSITTGVKNGTGTSSIGILSSPNGFLVKSTLSGTGTIEILDVTGNVVKVLSNVSLSNGNNFFTPEVAAGFYLIKVTMDNTSYIDHVSVIKQ